MPPIDPFAMPNPFGDPFNMGPVAPRAPATPALTPEEQDSLLSRIGSGTLHGLGWLGGSLSKAFGGRAIRGLLGGKPEELASIIPFSDTLGITNPENEVHGSDLLGGNKDTSFFSPEGIGGLGIDILTDPATYLTAGAGALTKLGKSARMANVLPKTAGARLAGLAASSPEAAQLAEHLSQITGKATTAAEVAGQRLGGHMGLHVPFTDIGTTFDLTRPGQAIAGAANSIPGVTRGLNALDQATSPVRKGLYSLFNKDAQGFADPIFQSEAVQNSAKAVVSAEQARKEITPILEKAQGLVGHSPGMKWSPEMGAASQRYGPDIATYLERAPLAESGTLHPEQLARFNEAKARLGDEGVKVAEMMRKHYAGELENNAVAGMVDKPLQGMGFMPRQSTQAKIEKFLPETQMGRGELMGDLFAEGSVAPKPPVQEQPALFHTLSYKSPQGSVNDAVKVLEGGQMRPIDTWADSAKGLAKDRAGANAAAGTATLVFDRGTLEKAGATIQDRDGIAKLFNQNAPKLDPSLKRVLFKGDEASPEFTRLSKSVDAINAKRAEFGLPPVQLESSAATAARESLQATGTKGQMSINDLSRYRPLQEMKPEDAAKWVRDNVLSGTKDAQKLEELRAAPHSANFLAEGQSAVNEVSQLEARLQARAEGLVNWHKNLDIPALEQTGGWFGHHPLEMLQHNSLREAGRRGAAESTFNILPKIVEKTPTVGSKPVAELVKELGLSPDRAAEAIGATSLKDLTVSEKDAAKLLRFFKPAETKIPEGMKPVLSALDSLTNLTKAGQTSYPATVVRNTLSDVFKRFTGGGAPIAPMFEAQALRSGKVIEGIADKVPRFKGLSDAEATKQLLREVYQVSLSDTMKFQTPEAAGIDPLLRTLGKSQPVIGAQSAGLGESIAKNIPGLSERTWKEAANPLNIRGVAGNTESKFLPTAVMQSAQTNMEELQRLATFIDASKQGFNPGAAMKKVTEAHHDFGNLSGFERDVMRRAIPFYCVPEDAEILTRDGWKNCDQLIIGEEVMTYSMEKDCIEWQKCEDKSIFDHNQSLMTFTTKKGKYFAFTPEHRWPVRRAGMNVKRTYGTYFYPEETRIVEGKKLRCGHAFIQNAQFLGTESILTPTQARLLGWAMTDGSFRFRGNHCEMVIYQSQHKFLDEVKEVAGGVPRKPNFCYASMPDWNDTVCVPVVKERVAEIRPYLDKDNLIKVVTRLSRPAAEAMYDAMYKADGTVAESRQSDFFGKQHPGIRAAFRILALMLGKTTTESGRGCYISPKRYLKMQSGKIGMKHYEGRVWCPRTPNGTWVMKQGTTIIITGNSFARQNFPQIAGELATNPGGRMAQSMRVLNEMQGHNQLIPEDVSKSGYTIPMGQTDEGKARYLTSTGLPMEDLQNLVSPERGLLSMLNPLVRLPIEAGMGRSSYNLQELPANYPLPVGTLGNQALMASPLARAFTSGNVAYQGLSSPTDQGIPAALRLLMGARTTNVDPEQARRAAVEQYTEQLLRSNPAVRQFSDIYVPAAARGSLSPTELQLLALYQLAQKKKLAK